MMSTHATSITALQLFQSLFCKPDVASSATPVYPVPDQPVQQATAKLISILRTLCALDGGWPQDKPRTPATLLPYVSDEVEELLEALYQWHSNRVADSDPSDDEREATPVRPIELLSERGAWMLWAIASSAPDVVKLLEGVPAKFDASVQADGVRLVPVLIVSTDATRQALDLTTQILFIKDQCLPDDCWLELVDQPLPPEQLYHWRQAVWTSAIAIAPELSEWQTGVSLDLLIPGHGWQSANVRLALEFVPLTLGHPTRSRRTDAGAESASYRHPDRAVKGSKALAPSDPAWLAQSDILTSKITFSDSADLEAAIAPVQLSATASRLGRMVGASAPRLDELTPVKLDELTLVKTIYEDANLDADVPINSWSLLRSPLTLESSCALAQWAWLRASRDWMWLMEGIPVHRLPLGEDWRTETLVAAGHFALHGIADDVCYLNVATGEWDTATASLSETDSLLQIRAATPLPKPIWQARELQNYVNEQFRQRSPLLAYLMSGPSIQLTPPVALPSLAPSSNASALTLQIQFTLTLTVLP